MKIINGKNYYTIKEILDKVNERCETKLKKNNSILQWFYRHKFPRYIDTCNTRYYDEEIMGEIIEYYDRRKKIKDIKAESKQKMRTLLDANKEFTRKYKTW